HGLRDQKSVPACDALRHKHGFGESRTAVVQRSVRHFHPGELRDESLEFEDRLQGSLCDLSLIRRIGCVKLRTRYQCIDNDGNVMTIDTGAHKCCRVDLILRSPLLKVAN